jgi:hypothetical protein
MSPKRKSEIAELSKDMQDLLVELTTMIATTSDSGDEFVSGIFLPKVNCLALCCGTSTSPRR